MRVVLLGASNLALGFPLIVRQLAAGLPRPLEIFAAIGHGRSYCAASRVLFRGLPAIDTCSLWRDLEAASSDEIVDQGRTLALVTDVGNDLIYGSTPDVIARRIEACLERFRARSAELVITGLPIASIERMSAARYHATKAVFFPRTGGSWKRTLAQARELNGTLAEFATRYSGRLIEQPSYWFGFDPIHIRRKRRESAWETIFSAWPSFQTAPASRLALRDAVRLRLAAPAERRLFGRTQRRTQPALTLGDVSVRLY